MRPTWDEYFLGIAVAVATRADCTRRQVGAVITRGNRIVSTGYNGSPAGLPGCLTAGACPRGRHYAATRLDDMAEEYLVSVHGIIPIRCICGKVWPCPDSAAEYSSYDNCVSCHAEANALIYSERDKCEGATLYCTDEPCFSCWKLISGAGIGEVVTPNGRVEVMRRVRALYAERSPES